MLKYNLLQIKANAWKSIYFSLTLQTHFFIYAQISIEPKIAVRRRLMNSCPENMCMVLDAKHENITPHLLTYFLPTLTMKLQHSTEKKVVWVQFCLPANQPSFVTAIYLYVPYKERIYEWKVIRLITIPDGKSKHVYEDCNQ